MKMKIAPEDRIHDCRDEIDFDAEWRLEASLNGNGDIIVEEVADCPVCGGQLATSERKMPQ